MRGRSPLAAPVVLSKILIHLELEVTMLRWLEYDRIAAATVVVCVAVCIVAVVLLALYNASSTVTLGHPATQWRVTLAASAPRWPLRAAALTARIFRPL